MTDDGIPHVGTAVHDGESGRVGLVTGHEGPYLQLRPLGGGLEWDADPARVRPIDPAELLSARVAEANARSRTGLGLGDTRGAPHIDRSEDGTWQPQCAESTHSPSLSGPVAHQRVSSAPPPTPSN